MTTLIEYLLACNILDILTGFLKAYDQKSVSSKKMRHGALSKLSIWCVVVVSMIVSNYLKTDLTTYVIGYYLIMEVVSIFENVSVFVPIPDKIKNILNNEQIEKTSKDETVDEVDPEIIKYIKEKTSKDETVDEVDPEIIKYIKEKKGEKNE